jgi:hypothetical protein
MSVFNLRTRIGYNLITLGLWVLPRDWAWALMFVRVQEAILETIEKSRDRKAQLDADIANAKISVETEGL